MRCPRCIRGTLMRSHDVLTDYLSCVQCGYEYEPNFRPIDLESDEAKRPNWREHAGGVAGGLRQRIRAVYDYRDRKQEIEEANARVREQRKRLNEARREKPYFKDRRKLVG